MTNDTGTKDANLVALAAAITELKGMQRDSNLTAVVMNLERSDFKKEAELPETPLFESVMAYIEAQQKLSLGAASDNLPFAIRALQGIYVFYGGDDPQVLALYQYDPFRHKDP